MELICKLRPVPFFLKQYFEIHLLNRFDFLFQIVKQKAFERAIAGDTKEEDPLPTFENIQITDDYKGPKLDESGVPSRDFMLNLETCFREQNKLHKRYIFQMLQLGIQRFTNRPSLVDLTIPQDG